MKSDKRFLMPGQVISKVTLIIRTVAALVILPALFFVPAGTLNWPEAWAFIILYLVVVFGILIWLKKNDPGLLKERMRTKKEAKRWDKYIILAYTLLLMIMPMVIGVDAVRFRWSRVPLALKALGFIGFIPAAALSFWAIRENTYLSDMVVIQDDRGHKVCTTGPYRYARHPMYLGVIFLFLCLPVALGSFYGFIPGIIIVILFLIRTSLEDQTLQKELPGYQEYAKKVRYKLMPGVW
jgi:protein-S-isoprenylcysteine O-methyltransferase Ste14